jgi:PIN domain nuclease of toxin-antitoxin system
MFMPDWTAFCHFICEKSRLATLPDHHNDPFDRMIIAQAIQEKLTCVASDERFPSYKSSGLQVLWQ